MWLPLIEFRWLYLASVGKIVKVWGSHWVCLSKEKYYFDSYGILPMKNINYEMCNTLQIQPDNTKMCGQLCLYILYKLSRPIVEGQSSSKGEKFDEQSYVDHKVFEDLILNTYE